MKVVRVHPQDPGRFRVITPGFLHGGKDEVLFQLLDCDVVLRFLHSRVRDPFPEQTREDPRAGSHPIRSAPGRARWRFQVRARCRASRSCVRLDMASGEIFLAFTLHLTANLETKYSARTEMSSGRSRSGGTTTDTTFSR